MAATAPDSKDERVLLDAIKKATDLVDKGETPDSAVEKVARENGFGPGNIRLVAQAYNTGRQMGQWRSDGDVLAKLAAFPLCDPDVVISRIYKSAEEIKKEAAFRPAPPVSSVYSQPADIVQRIEMMKLAHTPLTSFEKSAEVKQTPVVAPSVEKAYAAVQREKQAAAELSRKASAARDEVGFQVNRLVEYFKQASYARRAFADVELAARTYYGDQTKPLLDSVYAQARLTEKRAGDKPHVLQQPLGSTDGPLKYIAAAIKAAVDCKTLRAQADESKKNVVKVAEEKFRPFYRAEAPQSELSGPWSADASAVLGVSANQKQASGWWPEVAAIAAGDILAHKATEKETEAAEPDEYGDVADLDAQINAIRRQAATSRGRTYRVKKADEKSAMLGGAALGSSIGIGLSRTLGSAPKTKDDLVEDAWMSLEDPDHANELRKIKAHAMLTQLMTDPDDPISGHDFNKVLQHYNEIAAAHPRVAEHAATLRPVLRKRLQGHTEPFEAKELVDLEKGLAQSRAGTPNTSLLSDTPDKLLG